MTEKATEKVAEKATEKVTAEMQEQVLRKLQKLQGKVVNSGADLQVKSSKKVFIFAFMPRFAVHYYYMQTDFSTTGVVGIYTFFGPKSIVVLESFVGLRS